jgi:hypothetical protein
VLIQTPRHEDVLGEWKYSSTHSLTSALDGGEWSPSSPGRFNPKERALGTHCIEGWVGSRADLDAVDNLKISFKEMRCDGVVWIELLQESIGENL